jgi:hypothetical protein
MDHGKAGFRSEFLGGDCGFLVGDWEETFDLN